MAKQIIHKIILILFCINSYSNITAEKIKNILYLNSYNVGYFWSDKVTRGVHNVLDTTMNVNYYTEYLDGKRFKAETIYPNIYHYLEKKYTHKQIDLVLVSDNFAVEFLMQYINYPLFKNTKVVYCGIENIYDYPLKEIGAHGVIEDTDFENIFNIMHRLFPKRDTLNIFLDTTITFNVYRKEVYAYKSKYKKPYIKILDNYSRDSIANYINALSNNNLVYLINSYYNIHTTYDPYLLYLKNVTSDIPIFSQQFENIKGLVGGQPTSGVAHGELAAKIALQVLNNEPTEFINYPIPFFEFDYNKLDHYKIKDDLLPENSVIINKPASLLYLIKKYISLYYILVITSILIIIILLTRNTVLKRLKLKLEKTTERAIQSEALKTALIANISHEIRTPLNAIIGFTEVLMTENTDPVHFTYIKHIYQSSFILENLINNVIDLSLIDAKEIKLNYSKIYIPDLLDSIITQNKKFISESKKTELRLEFQKENESPDYIYTDKMRLRQTLQNLIKNAIKFSTNGSIIINYRLISYQDIPSEIRDKQKLNPENNKYCLFSVKDQGIGIPENLHQYIFERFKRLDQFYMEKHGGIGLGLNISKSLVEMMGGVIWFTSKVKEGSTFYFVLPYEVKRTEIREVT